MAREYQVNQKAACEASRGSSRINQSGASVFTIKYAWAPIPNNNGTESFAVIAESDDGLKLEQTLYTHNGKGDELPSYGMVHAIMTCAGVRSLVPQRGEVITYDFVTKKDEANQEDVYPALQGKRVGLVIQMEEYVNGSGQTKQRPQIIGAYNADSRKTAAEIWNKAEDAKSLDAQLRWLDANPVKLAKPKTQAAPVSSPKPAAGQGAFDDDDIPFN